MAHSNVRIVSAKKYLSTLNNHSSIPVNSRVYYRLLSAGTYSLYFGDGIRDLHKPATSLKEMREKVGSKSEAQNRNVMLVHYHAQLIYLLGRKELTFIGNNDVMIYTLQELLVEIGIA